LNLPVRFTIYQTLYRRLCSLVAIVLLATGFHVGNAQNQATPANTLTVNTRLVVLDVVVTDPKGEPVDGLSAKDFQVYEDGKLQRLVSVEPPAAHTLPDASHATGAATVFDPAKPASFGQSPVNILVLDEANTRFADSSFARRSLREYLTKQPPVLTQPTTLLSIYDDHFKTLQEFTLDREALLRALAAEPTKYAWKLEVNGNTEDGPIERLDQSLRALEEIAQSDVRIPGRKNLIWVGGGFPTLDPSSIDGNDAQEVKDALQHVTDVLLDARITLYAVDPTSSAAGVTEITDTTQLEFAEAAGGVLSGSSDPFAASDDFNRLGPVTGGRVVRRRNDVAQQIAASVELGARFYTIAYSPSSTAETSSQYRKIKVVCLRAGLTATTRSGYYSTRTPLETSRATAAYDLTTAAESDLPLNGLRVTVTPEAANDSYTVHVALPNLTWTTKDDGSATASVYIMTVSLNGKKRMIGHKIIGMLANAAPGADLRDAGKTADFSVTAKPESKASTLRFIARDSATGRMGSVDLPLAKH
jgi:VWFA-related protein